MLTVGRRGPYVWCCGAKAPGGPSRLSSAIDWVSSASRVVFAGRLWRVPFVKIFVSDDAMPSARWQMNFFRYCVQIVVARCGETQHNTLERTDTVRIITANTLWVDCLLQFENVFFSSNFSELGDSPLPPPLRFNNVPFCAYSRLTLARVAGQVLYVLKRIKQWPLFATVVRNITNK